MYVNKDEVDYFEEKLVKIYRFSCQRSYPEPDRVRLFRIRLAKKPRIRNIEPDNSRIQCTTGIEILIVAFYQGEAYGAAKNSRGKAAGQVSQESFYFNLSSGYLTCDHAIHNFFYLGLI
jgi:hypothetical protein